METKLETNSGSDGSSCSALPDSVGFWWWCRIYKKEWEMIRVKDFGDGVLVAYSINGDFSGASVNVAPERFAGEWVKILPPNVKVHTPLPARATVETGVKP